MDASRTAPTTPGCSSTSTRPTAADRAYSVVTDHRGRRRRCLGAAGAATCSSASCRLGRPHRQLRHEVGGEAAAAGDWSPLGDLDLAAVPAAAADHEPTLFMEDTGWPNASLDDYVGFWGDDYHPLLARQPTATRLLEIQACWVPAHGTGRRPGGDPLAAHPQPRPARRAAQHRGGPRAQGGRHLHGQCPRAIATSGSPACCAPPPGRPAPDGAGRAQAGPATRHAGRR